MYKLKNVLFLIHWKVLIKSTTRYKGKKINNFLQHYPQNIIDDVNTLIKNNQLDKYLKNKYNAQHQITSDKALYTYVSKLKSMYFKKYNLHKVLFDSKINVINNALGLHTFISRVQGNKLKAKNEIRISHIFKDAPKEFLEMIVVHELAHLKEKEHNKAFYKLCHHMLNNYAQVEFDLRLYLFNDYLKKKNTT